MPPDKFSIDFSNPDEVKACFQPLADGLEWEGHFLFLKMESLEGQTQKKPSQPLTTVFPYPKGRLKVAGADAAAFLQGIISGQAINQKVGETKQNLICFPNGHIAFDLFIERTKKEEFWMYTEPGEEKKVLDFLNFYHVLEEITITLEPKVYLPFLLSEQGFSLEGKPYFFSSSNNIFLLKETQIQHWQKDLTDAIWVGIQDFDFLRPIFSWPRSGIDFDASSYPMEAGLNHCVDYLKGCFIGQEPIARMYHKGMPTKVLCKIISQNPLAEKTFCELDGEKVGMISSASPLERPDGYFSLAMVKTRILESPLDKIRVHWAGQKILIQLVEPLPTNKKKAVLAEQNEILAKSLAP